MISEQLVLELDDVRLDVPWAGRSPRELAQELVRERLERFSRGAGVVDKSEVCCPSREALRIATDPAQLQICVSSSFPFALIGG